MIILKDLVIENHEDKNLDEIIKELYKHYEVADNKRFTEVATNLLNTFIKPVKETLQEYIKDIEREKRAYEEITEDNHLRKSKDLLDKTSYKGYEIVSDEEFEEFYTWGKQRIINNTFLDTINPLLYYIDQKVYSTEDIESMESLYSNFTEDLNNDYYLTVLKMMYFDNEENNPMLTDELLTAIKDEYKLKKLSDLFRYRDFIQNNEEDYMWDLEDGYTEEEFIESEYYKDFKHLDFPVGKTTMLKEYFESLYF